LERFWK